MTVERARMFAERQYERAQENPEHAADIRERWASREHFIADIALSWLEYGGGGGPDLIEVTEEVRKRFATPEALEQEAKDEIARLHAEARAVPEYGQIDESELNRRAFERLVDGLKKVEN